MSWASHDFEPVQQPRQRSGQRQQDQQIAIGRPGLDRGDGERAQNADADKGGDAGNSRADDDCKPPAPRLDDLHQAAQCRGPADRRGCIRELGRRCRRRLLDLLALAGDRRRGAVLCENYVALALLGLRSHQPAIGAVAADQLAMAAFFDDAAAVEHEDAVGADHARQPVRQDEGGAPGREPVDRLLDYRFVFGVDRGQCLVEDQNWRVAQESAGDRQPLALAARQHDSALADHRLITLRQQRDEFVGVGVAGGGLDLVLVGVGLAEPQIVLDGAVEQIGVLMHDRDHPAHRLGIERLQVAPADQHPPVLRVEQAQQQPRDRGFARAARADDADLLAGADRE